MNLVTRFLRKREWYRKLVFRSRHASLPGLQGIPVYDVGSFFYKQMRDIGLSDRAAAISFNIIMALPAAMILIATLIPYLPNAEAFRTEMLLTLSKIISDDSAYNLVASIINDFFEPGRTRLISVSFLFAAFFSSNAMIGIMDTFDKSFYEDRRDHFLAKRLTALKLTFLLFMLILASGLVLITQGSIRDYLLRKLNWEFLQQGYLIDVIRWLIIFALTYFTVAFIYRFAPATITKWKLSSPGTVVSTSLMILTTWIFSVWVDNFSSYNKVYGSLGAVLILLNLVYINSLILIIGFEINVSITSIKQKSELEKKQLSMSFEMEDEL